MDNFFVNQRLLDCIEDAGPVHLGDNLSRHSPIMIKIKLSHAANHKVEQPEIPRLRRPAWFKATHENKNQYTELLDKKLKELETPNSLNCRDATCKCKEHNEQRDKHVIDILCNLVETSYTCIPLTANPTKDGKSNFKSVPGWKENVGPLKSDSLFWHSVWVSAGRPSSGQLQQVMSYTCRKYHIVVKQAKRMASNCKTIEALEAAKDGDAALIKELKKSLVTKCTSQPVPDSLERKVTHDSIIDKFRECYQEQYNSAGTQEAMVNIKQGVFFLVIS